MDESIAAIRERYAPSKVTTQLINISKTKVPQQKSLEFLENLKCLYFEAPAQSDGNCEDGSSMQPILKLKTINAFTRPRYVALSYTWTPSPEEESVPSGGYLVEDVSSGSLVPSSVRNTVFRRMQRYMKYVKAKHLWIDRHCIQQVEGEAKEVGLQAMDRVYSLSDYPVTLLSQAITTSEQMKLLIEILSEEFVSCWNNKYSISRSKTLGRARRALDLLDHITSDPWFSRGWTYQENYRAGRNMTLLITHAVSIRAQKSFCHMGSLDGELCINASTFFEQATKLCLAWERNQLQPSYYKWIIPKAARYQILLQRDNSNGGSARNDDSAPMSMSPTIIDDIAKRGIEREWDRLAIIANCCQYVHRLDSTKLQEKHSLGLSLLALCLVNGEIFSNHPRNNGNITKTRTIPVTEYLHTQFFKGLRSPERTGKLTFNKGCRFSNVRLKEDGVETKGYLWRLDDEIRTTSFHRHARTIGRYKRQLLPLEWLVDRLAHNYPILSQHIYDILNLEGPLTPAQEWQLSMARKIKEAIDQEKTLCTATAPFRGPGPLSVAIFVIEPQDDDSVETDGDEQFLFEDESFVFTSVHRGQECQQSLESNDLDKQVSIEVDCYLGENDRQFPRLYTKRWVHGLCFFYGCSPRSFIFPWPASLQDL
jgi:hypothetical protein